MAVQFRLGPPMKKDSTKEIGDYGEELAVNFLKAKNYQILDRNYVPSWFTRGRKEIDIVVKKDKILVFVEVKTIEKAEGFFPEDKVDFKKQSNLLQAAEGYLMEKKISQETPWQIDVIAIVLNASGQNPQIEHLENVLAGY